MYFIFITCVYFEQGSIFYFAVGEKTIKMEKRGFVNMRLIVLDLYTVHFLELPLSYEEALPEE